MHSCSRSGYGCHPAYQIKGFGIESTMQAHILSLHTPSTPVVGSKGLHIFFSEISNVAYQIRREWAIEHHASTYSVLTHTLGPGVGSKRQTLSSEIIHTAYQSRREWSIDHQTAYNVLTHTFGPGGLGQKVKTFSLLN